MAVQKRINEEAKKTVFYAVVSKFADGTRKLNKGGKTYVWDVKTQRESKLMYTTPRAAKNCAEQVKAATFTNEDVEVVEVEIN